MTPYLSLLKNVLENGETRGDRTGTGTISIFGTQTHYNLTKGFPVVTTKKLHLRSIIHELLWFLKGETNIAYLKENKVRIWDEWADENGDLGPIYGEQWRSWGGIANDPCGIDQIADVIDSLKNNPNSRRHVVSAWNVSLVEEMALPPCHLLFQFYVHDVDSERPGLSCQLYQRSADLFLGVPFNIASYALLIHMIAQVCGYEARDFIHTIGDAHIYLDHVDQVREQITRSPKLLPTLSLNPDITDIDDFSYPDFQLHGYQPHPAIIGQVSV